MESAQGSDLTPFLGDLSQSENFSEIKLPVIKSLFTLILLRVQNLIETQGSDSAPFLRDYNVKTF